MGDIDGTSFVPPNLCRHRWGSYPSAHICLKCGTRRSQERPPEASLQRRLYDECVTAGWDPDRGNTFAEECAHLHEEVSEAFRAWRLYQDAEVRIGPDGKPEGVPIELADVLIGLFYNAEVMGFDLLEAVEVKHRYNLTRDYVAEGRQLHARPPRDADVGGGLEGW